MEMLTMDKFEFLADAWPMDRGKQTLILVHGAGMNCHSWAGQVEGLSAHANVLALNLPGHGTAHERSKASIGENVDYLVEFVEFLEKKHPTDKYRPLDKTDKNKIKAPLSAVCPWAVRCSLPSSPGSLVISRPVL